MAENKIKVFDWKCPRCNSENVIFWQSISRALDVYGNTAKTMWIDDLFKQCLDCEKEFY